MDTTLQVRLREPACTPLPGGSFPSREPGPHQLQGRQASLPTVIQYGAASLTISGPDLSQGAWVSVLSGFAQEAYPPWPAWAPLRGS